MALYPAGQTQITTPTGAEQVKVDGGGAQIAYLTTQQIANLAGVGKFTAITALNTVGAGTITAAGIVGKITARGGSQTNTAFTDTTATGALIEAALGGTPTVGQSWEWSYENATNANATLAAGATGVTLSPTSPVVFSGTTARFLVVRTAANTYTITAFGATAPTGSFGTFVANGTTAVTVADTRVTSGSAISITLGTVGGTVGDTPSVKTITPGTGFTVAGTASDTSTYNYLITG
jgi:hypothetical protein